MGEIRDSIGVVIQDWEGETIDYFGNMEDDYLKITGAQWGIIWRMFKFGNKIENFGEPKEIIIETDMNKILINTLIHDYYLVLIMKNTANITITTSKLQYFLEKIKKEMGL